MIDDKSGGTENQNSINVYIHNSIWRGQIEKNDNYYDNRSPIMGPDRFQDGRQATRRWGKYPIVKQWRVRTFNIYTDYT